MSETAKLPPIAEDNAVDAFPHKRRAISWTIVTLIASLALLAWDFSDIIFARQHRAKALELVKPGMRLTEAERTLNTARYTTLYLSPPGQPPMLDVATGSRLPFTLQALKKLAPEWKGQKQLSNRLMQITHFTLTADLSGVVQGTERGTPLVLPPDQTPLPSPQDPTATQ